MKQNTIIMIITLFLGMVAFSGCTTAKGMGFETKNKAFHVIGPAHIKAGPAGVDATLYDGSQYLSNPCSGLTLRPE